MARSWTEAQRREQRFWERIYVDRRPDIGSYSPISAAEMRRFAEMTLGRHGLRLEDLRGTVVLDVGCGPYGLLAGVHDATAGFEAPPRLTGVDPLMHDYATRLGLMRSRPRVGLVGAKAEELPVASGSCDLVFCTNALDHVERPDRAAAELARVLRPGGLAAISLHVVTPAFTPVRRLLRYVDLNHPHHFTLRGVARLLAREFERVELRGVISMLTDQPEFSLAAALRAPRKGEALLRWGSTLVLRSVYFNCWRDQLSISTASTSWVDPR